MHFIFKKTFWLGLIKAKCNKTHSHSLLYKLKAKRWGQRPPFPLSTVMRSLCIHIMWPNDYLLNKNCWNLPSGVFLTIAYACVWVCIHVCVCGTVMHVCPSLAMYVCMYVSVCVYESICLRKRVFAYLCMWLRNYLFVYGYNIQYTECRGRTGCIKISVL